MKKAYFQYYQSFEQVVQKFQTAEERDSFRSKIINYGLFGIEPESLSDRENMVWDLIRDMIDDQVHRREVNKQNRENKKKVKAPEVEQKTEEISEETPDEYEYKPTPQKTEKRFKKPTVEEIAEYCTERNNDINAQQFFDYYESRGWKLGKVSMKDWKAAVRTWEQRREVKKASGTVFEWPEDKLTLS